MKEHTGWGPTIDAKNVLLDIYKWYVKTKLKLKYFFKIIIIEKLAKLNKQIIGPYSNNISRILAGYLRYYKPMLKQL